MQKAISQIEHRLIVDAERSGQLLIGIDTQVARRFFTDTHSAAIYEAIGEPLIVERLCVRQSMALGWLLLLVSCGVAVWALGWWCVLAIPVCFILWLMNLTAASVPTTRLWTKALTVAIVCVLPAGFPISRPTWLWLLSFALSLFFAKATYTIATIFLRNLVLRNRHALSLLRDEGVILRDVDGVIYSNGSQSNSKPSPAAPG